MYCGFYLRLHNSVNCIANNSPDQDNLTSSNNCVFVSFSLFPQKNARMKAPTVVSCTGCICVPMPATNAVAVELAYQMVDNSWCNSLTVQEQHRAMSRCTVCTVYGFFFSSPFSWVFFYLPHKYTIISGNCFSSYFQIFFLLFNIPVRSVSYNKVWSLPKLFIHNKDLPNNYCALWIGYSVK